ncbi:DUF1614 domain-containing protein [bacterium]|nr:DUF1614 domain-containing protein [bacterium]
MIFLPLSIMFIFILLLPLFFFLLQIEFFRIALSKLGLSPQSALLIFFLSLIGSLINIPIYTREATIFYPENVPFSMFGNFGFQGSKVTKQTISINLGGCIIPILLCIYLLPRAPLLPLFFSTVITVIVCFKLSKIVPGKGITIPALLPPVLAVVMAYLLAPHNKIPVAYISGVLGVLIGADILNLPYIEKFPGVISIGGAGVFDGIFLVGIISALLA